MAETQAPKPVYDIETGLDNLYNRISPDPSFANQLERRLAAQAAHYARPGNTPFPSSVSLFLRSIRKPALILALAVLLLTVIFIGAAGPQRVLAEIQRLLGYAPGIGFVQPGQTRLLEAPVEVKQGPVTLRVDSVVADSKHTQVNITVYGLSQEKFIPTPGEEEIKVSLLMPDGTQLFSTHSVSGIGQVLQSTLDFPAIPENIDRVTLIFHRLPLLPAGFGPENWSVPLILKSANLPAATTGGSLAEPYVPENASASSQGITAQVLQAAQGQSETGVQVQFSWQNQGWTRLSSVEARLSDQEERQYQQHQPQLGPAFEPSTQVFLPGSQIRTFRFDPLYPEAKKASLTLSQLDFAVDSQAQFRFDPGENAQVGQVWDLSGLPGTHFEIAGIPIQVISATLTTVPPSPAGSEPSPGAAILPSYQISFLLQAEPPEGQTLEGIQIDLGKPDSSSCEGMPGNRMLVSAYLNQIPTRPLTIYLRQAYLMIAGPLVIEWNIPGTVANP